MGKDLHVLRAERILTSMTSAEMSSQRARCAALPDYFFFRGKKCSWFLSHIFFQTTVSAAYPSPHGQRRDTGTTVELLTHYYKCNWKRAKLTVHVLGSTCTPRTLAFFDQKGTTHRRPNRKRRGCILYFVN